MRGLWYMVASCFLFSGMYSCVYSVRRWEPDTSSLVSSFVRIVINLVILVAIAAATDSLKELFGDGRKSLWLRGMFGATALITGFASYQTIAIGEAAFLMSTSGVFVAIMSPYILGQKNTLGAWLAVGGALVGAALLCHPTFDNGGLRGSLFALSSGFCSALAYMMVARAGASNSPSTVIFYFCLVGTAVHLVLFTMLPHVWPREPRSYLALLAAGVLATAAQFYLTKAYQTSRATLNAAVSYLSPVLNLGAGIVLFGDRPDARSLVGAGVILICGGALPFLTAAHKPK